MAYVAYISDGTAHVSSAVLTPDITDMSWADASFSETASDVAIAFDARMISATDSTAEYVTDEKPWVFWVKDGVLKGRILGLLGDTELANANCTKVTAIRAAGGAIDFGLVLFFLLNGVIYYRQLINGVWTDAEAVTFGPSVTWDDIAAFRTWDYRIGIQGVDTDGNVYELFTQFEGLARHGSEHIDIDTEANGKMTAIQDRYGAEQENLRLSTAASSGPYGGLYRLGPAAIVGASNSAVSGNYGKKASFTFDRHLVAAEVAAQPTAFRIVDAYSHIFVAQTAALRADGLTVDLTFLDFNGAYGACSAVYVPGTVHTMAGVALSSLSFAWTPTGLVPPAVPAPLVSSITNTDDFTLSVTFDRALTGSLTGAASHFKLQISRPQYSPGGELSTVVLDVTDVTASGDDAIILSLGNGNLASLQTAVGNVTLIYDGSGPLCGDGGPVGPFSETFTPDIAEFKPDLNDPEHLEISASVSGTLTRIDYTDGAEREHLGITVTASGTLIHVDDL